ncbi:MAG: GNAT family N-acetyltransferase [Acidimicrobiia bacterium]|nr:GNAT family N-acetyltransferase [Acidimicrobiia bacterium]
MNRPTPVEFDGETLGDEELERIADLMTAVNAQWAPDDPPVSLEWARADLLRGNELFEIRRLLVEQAGRVVGLASIDLEQAEANRHIAELYIDVHPDFLRRGVGTALTAAAVRIAREEGRTSLAPWGPNTEASHAFWGRLDLPEVLADRDSRVTVADIDADLMHRWRTRSRARELGYELRSWVSPCPDEFMPLYVATQLGMNDAPLDDLDMAHPDIDEAWNRARERRNARRNAVIRVIAAVSPDGEPAGMTEVIVSSHRPWYVLQQGTTTLAAHRGQGLGRWLKAEMYFQLREHHPEAQIIETGNAASNAPMLAINNEMGFRVHVPHTIRQADVDVVAAALERLGSLDPAES